MALIKCPECGKEVSDRATACINCGYPLKEIKNEADTNGIAALFTKFALTATLHTKVADIYSDVLNEVAKIKAAYVTQEANDIIAKSLIDGLIQIPNKLGWVDTKLFCELINFDILSSDAIEYFADQLFTVISIQKYYDDGSGGYCNLTQYFYAEYMVMKYASDNTKSKYMTVLKTPYMGHPTAYDYVVTMYNQNSGRNTISQIAEVRRFSEGIGVPSNTGLKCPVCNSVNIKKISTIGRIASIATLGLASSKIGKQYQCNKCGHKW